MDRYGMICMGHVILCISMLKWVSNAHYTTNMGDLFNIFTYMLLSGMWVLGWKHWY